MRTFLALCGGALLMSVPAFADEFVHGYLRPDGTEVAPYHRTAPDSNPFNNYSTRGNTNPYTGAPGTVDPYRTPDSFSTPAPRFGNDPSGIMFGSPGGLR